MALRGAGEEAGRRGDERITSAREPGRRRWRSCSRLHEPRTCKDALLANGGGSAVTVGRAGMGPSVSASLRGGQQGGRGAVLLMACSYSKQSGVLVPYLASLDKLLPLVNKWTPVLD